MNDNRVKIVSTASLLNSHVSCCDSIEAIRPWDKLSQLIPTNSVYEKQDQNVSPSSNEADASLTRSLDENNVMDTSKLKGEGGDQEEEEEEEEGKLTYDTEEYEDEDKHEKTEDEEEEEEIVEEEDPSDTDNGATKKERSPPEASSVSNTETANDSRDEDYLEDSPANQYDNTYYYYDEYENGNRSRYEAIGEFFFLRAMKNSQ